MTDSISITGIEVFAHHGVLDREKAEGQLFLVDLTLALDLSAAGESDTLSDTIDYGRLAAAVHRLVAGERWDLIERVAARVAELALDDPRVAGATVTVHKPAAPIEVPFEDVTVTLVRQREPNRAAVALGSNMGDREATIRRAMRDVAGLGHLVAVSSLYETAPIGGPQQAPFLNAVAVIDTPLGAHDLLDRLLTIEDAAGRERVERWGPRTLDLDLVTMVDGAGTPISIESDRLVVPHPRAAQRRFVVEPMAEVWPTAPLGARTAFECLPDVAEQGVVKVGAADAAPPSGPSATSVVLVLAQVTLLTLFGVLVFLEAEAPVTLTPPAVLGGVLALLGVGIFAWSWAALGSHVSPFPEPTRSGEMIESGPYQWVRHPMYTGLILILLGVSIVLAASRALAATGLLAVFLWFKARYEERLLLGTYGGYGDYRRRVRGRLVPLGRRSLS